MMKIALIGHGKMGRMLDELIAREAQMQVTGIVDARSATKEQIGLMMTQRRKGA